MPRISTEALLGVTSVLFALNRGPEWGWSSPGVIGGFLLGPLALAAFVVVERRAPEPLLPLDIIRRRNFALPIGAAQVETQTCHARGVRSLQRLAQIATLGAAAQAVNGEQQAA